ncbi:MAG: ArnT family glycosyltransferase [Candidatus Micrarchaeales archaeon]
MKSKKSDKHKLTYDLKRTKDPSKSVTSTTKKSTLPKYSIALVLIMMLGVFLSVYFFYGPSPINYNDNYIYSNLAYLMTTGSYPFINSGILAQRYILIGGIALFYYLFSPSRISAAGFGIICFILNIAVVYKIGSELYNKKGGILSALVYSFSAIDVVNASYVGDNGPMALIVSLSVLMLIIALKSNKKHNVYYFLAGMLPIIGILISSQTLEIMLLIVIVLIFYVIKNRNRLMIDNILMFSAGIVLAILFIIALSSTVGNHPFYILGAITNHPEDFCTTSPILRYTGWMFPENFTLNIYNIANAVRNGTNVYSSLSYAINYPFKAHANLLQEFNTEGQSIGLYAYFAILGAISLLIAKRFKSAAFPALWVIVTFGFMGFGVVSLKNLLFICTAAPRLMLIFTPALALLIGMGMAGFMDLSKNRNYRYAACAISVILIIVLFYSSYVLIRYTELSQYKYIYPILQISNFIKTLPKGTIVYTDVQLDPSFYGAGYFVYGPITIRDCNNIRHNSYVILNTTYIDSIMQSCNLSLAFAPPATPKYLQNYTGLSSYLDGYFGILTNERVYYRN